MGETYSKPQGFNQNRAQNTNTSSGQSAQKEYIYTCWSCEKQFSRNEPGQPDAVRCPYCKSIHGHITHKLQNVRVKQ